MRPDLYFDVPNKMLDEFTMAIFCALKKGKGLDPPLDVLSFTDRYHHVAHHVERDSHLEYAGRGSGWYKVRPLVIGRLNLKISVRRRSVGRVEAVLNF